MIVRLFLVLSLVTASFASRAPVELAEGVEVAALVDVLEATLVAMQSIAPVQPPRVTSEIPRETDVAPPSPDLGRVFRPPRASLS